MGRILDLINSGTTLVSDGAWGTLLQLKGLKTGECPEFWNITHKDDVFNIAKSYIDAGADMIETNSFGGNCFKLAHYGLEKKVHEINKIAAEISRKAAGDDHFVIGSIGSTGKMLMMEEISPEEMYEAFSVQAIALESGSADAILIETMTDLEEAVLAVKAARENTLCEVFCTMTFEKTPNNEYHTIMGVTPVEMTKQLTDAGAAIIGANCGNGAADMVGIVNEIRNYNKSVPILIQANAGLPVYNDGKIMYTETPEEMANTTQILINTGTNIVGGCCGTTPEHIKRIAEVVKTFNREKRLSDGFKRI